MTEKYIKPVSVATDIIDLATKQRQIRALLRAGKAFGCKNLVVITNAQERSERVQRFGKEGNVRFVPLWRFLLNGG